MTDLPATLPDDGHQHYNWALILLHWGMAVLLTAQVTIGLRMVSMPGTLSKFDQFQLHKAIGVCALVLVLLRLCIRVMFCAVTSRDRQPLPRRFAASAAHALLYAAMIAVPVTGWVTVSASPSRIPTLLFGGVILPSLPVVATQENVHFAAKLHAVLALTMVALIAFHVAAVLWHCLIRKDRILARMLP